MLAKATRATGWLLVAGAVFLTIGPQKIRPVTGVEHNLEHFLAFALVGLVFGLGYPRRLALLLPLAIAVAAVLETAQLWIPLRHAYFSDFAINALGACIGLLAAAAITAVVERYVDRARPEFL
jgi:VanZ family protein